MISKPDPAAIAAAVPVAAATPIYGEYALIVLGALAGSLIALSRITPSPDVARSRWASALFVFRGVTLASVVSGALASWVSARTGVEFYRLLMPVACLIAAVGDDWGKIKDYAIEKWVKK